MKNSLKISSLAILLLSSCIENDIPYPVVVPVVSSLEAEGAVEVNINSTARTVEIVLNELTDIRTVKVTSVTLNPESAEVHPEMTGTFDLTGPKKFVLTTYDDYEWELRATKNIERSFIIQGQVGQSVIDDVNHRVVASVPKKVSLKNIQVTSFKLGPAGITEYSEDLTTRHDYSEPVELDLSYFGKTEHWKIFVTQSESSVTFRSSDAWTRVA